MFLMFHLSVRFTDSVYCRFAGSIRDDSVFNIDVCLSMFTTAAKFMLSYSNGPLVWLGLSSAVCVMMDILLQTVSDFR